MSVTYTDDHDSTFEEGYVPVYARRGRKTRSKPAARVVETTPAPAAASAAPAFARTTRKGAKPFKTWMVLAPVGVLAIGGIGAMMLFSGGESETAAPLVEADTAPVVSAAPLTPTVVEAAPTEATPVTAPAPVDREAVPATRAATPLRRAAAPATRTPAAPASRQSSDADAQAQTSALNRAQSQPAARPAATPAPVTQPTAPAPAQPRDLTISTQPLG